MTYPATHISISIDCPKAIAYTFASNPENFPGWIAFIESISKKSVDTWTAETDLGKIDIECTPKNDFGIIDHSVTLPDGTEVNNPLRIIENGNGCEAVFTLYKMPGRTQKDFDDDAKLVAADLKNLKDILEK